LNQARALSVYSRCYLGIGHFDRCIGFVSSK
jgi:hypothetical protein